MAIYHLTTKPIARAKGRTATAAAAYRSGRALQDPRTGEVHDYTRKGGVDLEQILAPEGWAEDPEALWKAAEEAEKRSDARVAREWEISLPAELTPEQNKALAMEMGARLVDRYGVAAHVCCHRLESETNPHAHLLCTTRGVGPEGLGDKVPLEWSNTRRASAGLEPSRKEIEEIRAEWAALANEHLAKAGHDARIDHRSLEEQGIEAEPTPHVPLTVVHMEDRGIQTRILHEIDEKLARQLEEGQHEEAAYSAPAAGAEGPESRGGPEPGPDPADAPGPRPEPTSGPHPEPEAERDPGRDSGHDAQEPGTPEPGPEPGPGPERGPGQEPESDPGPDPEPGPEPGPRAEGPVEQDGPGDPEPDAGRDPDGPGIQHPDGPRPDPLAVRSVPVAEARQEPQEAPRIDPKPEAQLSAEPEPEAQPEAQPEAEKQEEIRQRIEAYRERQRLEREARERAEAEEVPAWAEKSRDEIREEQIQASLEEHERQREQQLEAADEALDAYEDEPDVPEPPAPPPAPQPAGGTPDACGISYEPPAPMAPSSWEEAKAHFKTWKSAKLGRAREDGYMWTHKGQARKDALEAKAKAAWEEMRRRYAQLTQEQRQQLQQACSKVNAQAAQISSGAEASAGPRPGK